MPRPTKCQPERGDARARLLVAARDVIRAKGLAATSVDELCRAAQVTKGAFFHHFPTKEALAVAAAGSWAETTAQLFAEAPFQALADPLDRVLAYLDFRRSLIRGEPASWTCLVGTMVQEAFATHPAIRDACARSMLDHAATLEPDIAAAMAVRGIEDGWTAASLARHIQAVLQGAFVLAKASGEREMALECVDHVRRYVELLFLEHRGKGTQA